jgi:ATP-dependent Lon protease
MTADATRGALPGPGDAAGDGRHVPLPDALPVLPLRGAVVFPGALVPVTIGRAQAVRLVDDAMRTNRLVALVAQRQPDEEWPGPDGVYDVGTATTIVELVRVPQGVRVLLQGRERVRLGSILATDPYLVARVEALPERPSPAVEVEGLRRAVLDLVRRLAPLLGLPQELVAAAEGLTDPRELAYVAAAVGPFDTETKQAILELDPLEAKLERLVEALQHELAVRQLGEAITTRTTERLTKAQREAILREQLRSIQAELGEGGEGSELDALRRSIEEARLPEEPLREATRELDRLASVPEASPEHGLIRTWLEWVAALPWSAETGGEIDMAEARRVLDEDHYDLAEVKDRILEHLAVRKLRRDRGADVGLGGGPEPAEGGLEGHGLPDGDGGTGETDGVPAGSGADSTPAPTTPAAESGREPILCFVGPPGVGKTSLGQSIARALGRRFVRMSLGGVHDESEIRGHRRTYVGAFPGRILQGLRRVETRDPVFMLDEIDKLGADWRGDPSSALLEVLDPAQNGTFTDTYLGLPFDLSKVLFIATANTVDTIPGPLLDRTELLRLAGYTDEEKVRIAQQYLVPQQRRAHGLSEDEVTFEEEALRAIVRGYTREAGVRELDRRIAQACRKVARRVAEADGRDGGPVPHRVTVTEASLPDLLGRPRHRDELAELAERTERPGVATGLAWTPVGGEILFVEAAMMPDGGETPLILTGMLGDVMRESAQAALSYVRSEGSRIGIDERAFVGKRVHVHVPAGALPKDGPSAGVAIATALASLGLGRPVREGLAMTGEITLRGRVLGVGGIKEKVLAAHRAGIRSLVLPSHNEPDLDDVPGELRDELTIRLVDRVEEAWEAALGSDAPEAEAS